jgi:hypothetical protein
LGIIYDREDVMPNCQACPISHECQDAKKYMEYVHHEKFGQCVLVGNLNYMLDTYISVGLGDPKGYKHSLPDSCAQRIYPTEVLTDKLIGV